jgi:hypothetical protein
MLPLGFSLLIQGVRLSFSRQLQFQLTNSSVQFLVQLFLAIFSSRADYSLVNLSLLLSIWACEHFTACSALAFFCSTTGREDWLFKAHLIAT